MTTRLGRRVDSSELSKLQDSASRVRNVCILAHVDHGKTTLSDGLVCSNGIISSKLAGKLRYLDSTEDEQKRGITMHSSAISLLYTNQARQRPPVTPEAKEAKEPREARDAPPGVGRAELAEGDAGDDYLINLIDSPGHIDFSSDVSTATRLCDCGLIVVDVLEGVCAQTHAVFRQARAENMRALLVLNKVDRLASELQLTPLEAWQHLQRLVENVNALTATLATADELAELDEAEDQEAEVTGGPLSEEGPISDRDVEAWTFSPEKGNVVFCSALDGWGFGLGDFARLWAKRVGYKPRELRRILWGSFVMNAKTKKVTKWTPSSQAPPMFVSMILDPIWQLYDAAVRDKNGVKAGKMATKLGLDVPPRELASTDPRTVLQAVMKRWLPLSEAVLRMLVEQGLSPADAQASRVKVLWPPPDMRLGTADALGDEGDVTAIMQEMAEVRRAVAECDASPTAPVVIFVSKMVPVKRRDMVDVNGKPWRPPSASRDDVEQDSSMDDPESLAFVAFARVLSGVVTPNTPLLVLGPKYHPMKQGGWRHASPLGDDWTPPKEHFDSDAGLRAPLLFTRRCKNEGGTGSPNGADNDCMESSPNVALFMMMGAALQPVSRVPAGNVLALAGLEGKVNKCATLSDTPACPAMRAVTLQAKPMVRVAVEALHQQDMDKLELGLSRLYQADPAVEVSVTTRGEHVVACLGELHLEQSLKDLRERYAGVELKASLPLVSFRETVVAPGQAVSEDGSIIPPPQLKIAPWADEEGLALADYKTGRVRVVTPDRRAALSLRCVPLPPAMARLIDEHPREVGVLSEEIQAARGSTGGGGGSPAVGGQGDATLSNACRAAAFRGEITHALADTGLEGSGTSEGAWHADGVEDFLSRVLAFGPRNIGANVLARCEGGVEVTVAMAGDNEEFPVLTTRAPDEDRSSADGDGRDGTSQEQSQASSRQATSEEANEALRLVENSIITGFQLATLAGPLAGEEMHGLCFLLERVEIDSKYLTGHSSGEPPSSGSFGDARPGVELPVAQPREVAQGDEQAEVDAHVIDNAKSTASGKAAAGGEDDDESVATGSAKESAPASSKGRPRERQQQRRFGPLTGQVISVVRMGCRASMLSCPVRLVEAFYRCSLQCDQEHLGNMYAVLSKRRGRVLDEDLVEGTQLFLLTALLPVAESFGFANELLKKTSGSGTTPQLSFSHWEMMELDPFWRPQTNEEREDEGEEGHLSVTNISRQYLDGIRRRKGLATNDKIVVAAEKQRTLTRNK